MGKHLALKKCNALQSLRFCLVNLLEVLGSDVAYLEMVTEALEDQLEVIESQL